MEGEAHTWLATAFAMDEVSTPAGLVSRPSNIPVTFQGPIGGPLTVECLFDSGSDVTLIPPSVGKLIGLDPANPTCPVVTTYGVSGSTQGELCNVQLTVAGETFIAPVLITATEDSPPIVGRAAVWGHFKSITIDNDAGAVCFGEPTTPLNQLLVNPSAWVIAGGIVAGFVLWAVLK